jgi:hypothetical protein
MRKKKGRGGEGGRKGNLLCCNELGR